MRRLKPARTQNVFQHIDNECADKRTTQEKSLKFPLSTLNRQVTSLLRKVCWVPILSTGLIVASFHSLGWIVGKSGSTYRSPTHYRSSFHLFSLYLVAVSLKKWLSLPDFKIGFWKRQLHHWRRVHLWEVSDMDARKLPRRKYILKIQRVTSFPNNVIKIWTLLLLNCHFLFILFNQLSSSPSSSRVLLLV